MSISKVEYPGFEADDDAWVCHYCEVFGTTRAEFDAHLRGKRHQKYLRFGAHPGQWFCWLCDTKFSYELELAGHIAGKDAVHQAMSIYYAGAYILWCALCDKPLFHSKEQHLKGNDHTARLAMHAPPQCQVEWCYLRRNHDPVTLDMQRCMSPLSRMMPEFPRLDHTRPEDLCAAVRYAQSLFDVAPTVEAPIPAPPLVVEVMFPVARTEEEYKEQGRALYLANLVCKAAADAADERKDPPPSVNAPSAMSDDAPVDEACPAPTGVHEDHGAIMYDGDGNMMLVMYDEFGTPVFLPLDH